MIIFVFFRIFRNSHKEIFDLEKLADKYEIKFLDLTALSGGKGTATDSFLIDRTVKIQSIKELVDFRKKYSKRILFVVNDGNLNSTNNFVFNIILQKEDKLLSFNTRKFVCNTAKRTALNILILNALKYTSMFIPFYMLKKLWQRIFHYRFPDYYMVSTDFLIPTKIFLGLPNSKIIITHNDDINRSLELKTSSGDKKKRTGIFVDQLLPFAFYQSFEKEEIRLYYHNIIQFLLEIKEKYLLDVIIFSKHPESHVYQDYFVELENMFSGIIFSQKGTIEEIIDSNMVIAHFSASISMAVYYKKPILLLTTNKLQSIPQIVSHLIVLENELNLPVLNIDQYRGDLPELKKQTDLYENYIRKYVKNTSFSMNSYHYAISKILD